MEEIVRARGHEHVSATHASTLELTSDDYLTPAGDCILGIETDRVPTDFDPAFVEACQDEGAWLTLTLEADDYTDTVRGHGDPRLTFESERSLVCRTSEYVDERTVMAGADGAAADLDRGLVTALAQGAELRAVFRVE